MCQRKGFQEEEEEEEEESMEQEHRTTTENKLHTQDALFEQLRVIRQMGRPDGQPATQALGIRVIRCDDDEKQFSGRRRVSRHAANGWQY